MVQDIQVSYEEQLEDLVEQLKSSRVLHRDSLHEIYVSWLWSDGEIIVKHPLWKSYGDKGKLLSYLSEQTGYSKRYFQYAVKVYNAFPVNSPQEALEAAHKALPDKYRITQRDLISFVSGSKKNVSLHTNFKNAIPIPVSELKVQPGDIVRIYRDGEVLEFKITDETA